MSPSRNSKRNFARPPLVYTNNHISSFGIRPQKGQRDVTNSCPKGKLGGEVLVLRGTLVNPQVEWDHKSNNNQPRSAGDQNNPCQDPAINSSLPKTSGSALAYTGCGVSSLVNMKRETLGSSVFSICHCSSPVAQQ